MTTQDSTLVIKDQAGDYYLIPRDTLERGRVPAERSAAVERLLGEIERGDVQGYFLPAIIVAVSGAIGIGAMIGIGVSGPDLSGGGLTWDDFGRD